MIINHNMNALNAHRQMVGNTNAAGKSMEKLSSGLRINRAGDDAAGLAISEKMRGQIRGLEQAQRNAQDGISLIQTAEGALNETQSILQRMRELAVQADNGTTTLDDRKEIQKEINELIDEIDRIGNQTEFNTKTLMNGDYSDGGVKFHIGANEKQNIELKIKDMRSSAIGTAAGTGITSNASVITDYTDATDATGVGAKTFTLSFGEGEDAETLDITLDKDYGDAAGVANAINEQINAEDSKLEGLVEVKVLAGGKLSFVNKTDIQVEIVDAATNGALDDLKIDAGTIKNTIISVKSLKVDDVDAATTGGVLNGADAAITIVDDAIKQVSAERAKLGAYQNRLEHTINNLGTSAENLTAAESRIRDVDMAKEMMNFSKNNILQQAAQAMLAQANQQPQGVLQLLR